MKLILAIFLGTVGASISWAQPSLRLSPSVGHHTWVASACFSPDGAVVLTGGWDGEICMWNLRTGRELAKFKGHREGGVFDIAYSPDGTQFASCGQDNRVVLWSSSTRRPLRTFVGHTDTVYSVEFDPAGTKVLTASKDGTAKIWNLSNGKAVTARLPRGAAYDARFSPDGKAFATAGTDGTVSVWSAKDMRLKWSCKVASHAVLSVRYARGGTEVVALSGDAEKRLFELKAGYQSLVVLTASHGLVKRNIPVVASDFEILPDGRSALLATPERLEIQPIDGNGATPLAKARPYFEPVRGEERTWENTRTYDWIAINRDASSVLLPVGGMFGTDDPQENWGELMQVWGRQGRLICNLGSKTDQGQSIGINRVGDRLAQTDWWQVSIWNLRSAREVLAGSNGSPMSVAFSPDGTILAIPHQTNVPDSGQGYLLWDMQARAFRTLRDHVKKPAANTNVASWSPDGTTIATGGDDHHVRIWAIDGTCLLDMAGHQGAITDLCWMPDGSKLISASQDGSVRFWDPKTGLPGRIIRSGDEGFASVDVSKSGDELLAVSGHAVRLWSLSTGAVIWLRSKEGIASARFSDDGKLIAVASWDYLIELWRLDGSVMKVLRGHTGWVVDARFCDHDQFVASVSVDGTARIWNASTGKELCALISFVDGTWAVIDPQGRFDSDNGGRNPNLYWQYEDPTHHVLETFDLDQFASYYYTPGLLGRLTRKELLPPVPDINKLGVYPKVDTIQTHGKNLSFNLTPRGGGLGDVRVLVNGQEVSKTGGRAGENVVPIGNALQGLKDPQIEVVAFNAEGSLSSPRASGTANPPPVKALTPTRYVAVLAGIEKYEDPSLDLNFAVDDMLAMAQAVKACAKGLNIEPEIYVLSNSPDALALKAEGATILPATKVCFDKLFTHIIPVKGAWRDSDLLFAYFAGHGTTYKVGPKSHYAYLTQDAHRAELTDAIRGAWAVTDDEIVKYFSYFHAGKRVLILDTCAAGEAKDVLTAMSTRSDVDRQQAILETQRRTGTHILLGCPENAVSYESGELRHGVMTYQLLLALQQGGLDTKEMKDAVLVQSLFKRVYEGTINFAQQRGMRQQPQTISAYGQDFPIGFLDDAGKKAIPIDPPLLVFMKPQLVEETAGEDTLTFEGNQTLSEALGEALRQHSAGRGGEKPVADYREQGIPPTAYRIAGSYKVAGDLVKLTLKLRRKDKPATSLPEVLTVQAPKAKIVDVASSALLVWAKVRGS